MNKVNLDTLSFEITRDCNLQCLHCARGNSQRITISEEIIDKVLDNINSCPYIGLTGGEPFLYPEIIEYLVDGIIKRNLDVFGFSCITNGTIYSEKIVQIYKKIGNYCNEKILRYSNKYNIPIYDDNGKQIKSVCIGISSDPFHINTRKNDIFYLYKKELEKYNIEIILHQEDIWVNKTKNKRLYYSGNLIENYEKLGKPKCKFTSNKYRIDIDDYHVKTTIEVGANGNIGIGSQVISFEEFDKNSMGNILESDMLTMIANNYYHEPFSKKEIRKQLKYKDIMYGFRDGDKNFANKMFLYMEKDKEIRRMLIDKGFDFNKAKEMSFIYLDIISDGLYSKEFQNMKGKI